ncbi:MAG: YeeE/YedE family protein, partial [Proteobacteria bacterium]|nr:YeeE/YedE family protein [Pseudomonadota bacterium]
PYLNPYIGGIGIGTILFLSFFLVGKGLGASGALTRLLAFGMDKIAPVHTAGISYFDRYLTSSTHPLDNWLVYMMIGIVAGGLIAGIRGKRIKTAMLKGDNTTNKRRIVTAFVGGLLVAFGARLAGGCTSGLALTGASIQAVAGWVFFMSVFAAGLFVAYFIRKEWL